MNEPNIFALTCKWCGHPQDIERGVLKLLQVSFKRFTRKIIKCGECNQTLFIERHWHNQPMMHTSYPPTFHCGKRLM